MLSLGAQLGEGACPLPPILTSKQINCLSWLSVQSGPACRAFLEEQGQEPSQAQD